MVAQQKPQADARIDLAFAKHKKQQSQQPDQPWKKELIVTKWGNPKALLVNATHALREAPGWKGVLGFDAFKLRTILMASPPWIGTLAEWVPRHRTDDDDVKTAEWLQRQNISVNTRIAAEAVETVAHDFIFHPAQHYLDTLEWDGEPRLNGLFSTYFGAERNLYTETVSRISLIAAVARIYEPGCKVDTVPILEGEQGTGKSTAIKTLFGSLWFSDEIAELGSKDAAMQTAGVWCIELAELDSLSRAATERIKAFLSRTTDRFRPPYGRTIGEYPRQCVFWGSTNGENYLTDETGGRRFLPIATGKIDIFALEDDAGQLWAEAVQEYRRHTPWWIFEVEAEAVAKVEQRGRLKEDPWTKNVNDFLNTVTSPDRVTMPNILQALGVQTERQNMGDARRVAGILRTLGWVRRQVRIQPGKREWRYVKNPAFDE